MKLSFRQLPLFLVLLLVIVSLSGCASMFAAPEDPPELKRQKAYMAARKEFAQTVKKYNDHYDVAPKATQEIWKVKFDPKFELVDKALKSWKMAIDEGFDPDAQEQLYLKLKSELLLILVDVFGEG